MARRERWDGDVRGSGVGDASSAAPGLRQLMDLCSRPGWVAEGPEVHLGGHIRQAAEANGLAITGTLTTGGGLFRVWFAHEASLNRRGVRMAAWAVIGAIAEATTHVREVPVPEGTDFWIVTGVPDDVHGFAAHGHHVLLRFTATKD